MYLGSFLGELRCWFEIRNCRCPSRTNMMVHMLSILTSRKAVDSMDKYFVWKTECAFPLSNDAGVFICNSYHELIGGGSLRVWLPIALQGPRLGACHRSRHHITIYSAFEIRSFWRLRKEKRCGSSFCSKDREVGITPLNQGQNLEFLIRSSRG